MDALPGTTRPRFVTVLATIGMCILLADAPKAAENTRESLRAAVTNLAAEYGDAYPGAKAFLQRLDAIDPQDTAALDALRREALLAHPRLVEHLIVYVVRKQYRPDHHNTGTLFQNGEVNAGSFEGGGAIRAVDFGDGGRVKTLLETADGVPRDLDVAFDGSKVLFALREDALDEYHIYEMKADGTGLTRLTSDSSAADVDPCYLPCGDIVFTSTRDPKYCGCNQHIQGNLFRMEADGANIRQIGRNNLFESRPSVMPDGRILYDRWEYVDRHYGPSFGLWTSLPDGRRHSLFYGNNAWSPGAIFDARILPGSERFIAVFGACHDRPWGALVVVDRRIDMDGVEPIVRSWPKDIRGRLSDKKNYGTGHEAGYPNWNQIDLFKGVKIKYEDPYPLDGRFFLCSRMTGEGERTALYLVDLFGNEIQVHADGPGCFDPMPLGPRETPPIIPDDTNPTSDTGRVFIADVYRGGGMESVPRGTIKTLRIVEAPPKRHFTHPLWRGDTLQRPAMNFNCTNNKRVLGDAAVEEDGSVYCEVPADRFIFFQALDENGMMVQSMRSGTTVRPGETLSCAGCHEHRISNPIDQSRLPLALRRTPDRLRPWHGSERNFSYTQEVQPIFDAHCVSCHDYGKEAEESVNLCGDLGLAFNVSYLELRGKSAVRWFPDAPGAKKLLVKAVDDGPPEVLPPYAWGSHRSRLVDVLREEHYGVRLSPEELDRVITWIDLNAPYYPTYASNYPDNLFGRSPLNGSELARLQTLTGVPVAIENGAWNRLQGTQVNFTRPEESVCLRGFKDKNDPKYREAVAIIERGMARLEERPRADMPGFSPKGPSDLQRLARLDHHCSLQQKAIAGLSDGTKAFDPKPKRPVAGNWITPKRIVSSSGTPYPCPEDPNRYAADKTIDRDRQTFCCLLDDTPGGNNTSTIPHGGDVPVTGHILYDLGEPRTIAGVRITAKPTGGVYNPKDVCFYTSDGEPEKASDRKPITIATFPPISSGARHVLRWEPKKVRYIGLEVRSSFENRGTNFNFQLAEIGFLEVE